jgi:hypothetical protein
MGLSDQWHKYVAVFVIKASVTRARGIFSTDAVRKAHHILRDRDRRVPGDAVFAANLPRKLPIGVNLTFEVGRSPAVSPPQPLP